MNCYYHPEKPALGICKHCQRGICTDCIAEVDDSLACKDRHEKQVLALGTMVQRNLLQAGRVSSVYRRNAIFFFWSGYCLPGSESLKFAG